MENKKPQIDYKKLTSEQRDKLEAYEFSRKQLTKLEDLTDMVHEIINIFDDFIAGGEKTNQGYGALLADVRNTLVEIKNKEEKEIPDWGKPVVSAISELGKTINTAISKIEFNPVIPKQDLKIDIPKVDFSQLEKTLKSAFSNVENAIKSIPTIELPEYPDRWDEVLRMLESIDDATRMKPQAPNVLKVMNPDGTSIGSLSGSTEYESRNDTTTDTNLVYLGKALPGSATSDAAWQIKRYNKSAGTMTFADDVTTFTKIWDSRTGYTY